MVVQFAQPESIKQLVIRDLTARHNLTLYFQNAIGKAIGDIARFGYICF